MVVCWWLAVVTLLKAGDIPAQNRILFLGDSITYGGRYIELVETALILEHPQRPWKIYNLGLASETVSGLSEEGHAGGKFPRPHLQERLGRVLDQVKPELVVACYGMNCGIYHPLEEKRFKAYRSGIENLKSSVEKAGAQILFITPPVFDAQPLRGRTLPAGKSSYPQPYAQYNDVLFRYADWLMERGKSGWKVLDLHSAMRRALREKRQQDPEFTFSTDGVHPGEEGHQLIAQLLLDHWGLKTDLSQITQQTPANQILTRVEKKQRLLKDAWLTATKHLRPGVKTGLPLPEAEAQAALLDQEMQLWLKRLQKSSPPPKNP
jgi:lysophospholipase L1-like esterase